MIAGGLLCELPLGSGFANVALGCQCQSQVVGGFVVAVYPRKGIGKMLLREIVLVENNFEPARRLSRTVSR